MASFAVALVLAAGLGAGPIAPQFSIPSGWVDVSPGAPEANFGKLNPAAAREARSGKFAAMAFDFEGTRDDFTANLNVTLNEGGAVIDESKREEIARQLVAGIREVVPSVQLRESSVVEIDGVRCLQVVYDTDQQGHPLRQMAVVMPAGARTAIATYTARRDAFERYRAAFEASAQGTTGLAEPPRRGIDFGRAARAGVIGALIGGVVAAVAGFARRRPKG